MLDIKQIESFYPEPLRSFKANLLREYLQYKILEVIFDSEFGNELSFMGGTALRIVHSNTRFSEDLDFDNLGLNQHGFKQLVRLIQRKLELEGYRVETKTVFKGAFHGYIKISNILFEHKLSSHPGEKLLIQVEAEPQRFRYAQKKVIINKFDLFLRMSVVPMDVLLAQKIYAIFNRKRPMGRDFYDTVFLLGKTKPNLDYLRAKLKIKDEADLKKQLLLLCKHFDFQGLSRDVEPFLFVPSDQKRVLFFQEYLNRYEF